MAWTAFGRRLEALEKKHEQLDEALERVSALEVDWQDYLHKMRNVLARLNQRARDSDEGLQPARRSINPAAARLLGFNHEGP